ncbi:MULTISPECIES: hypothetical protein [unclassified Streptomyces]|uniref:hypothetical protein n=1 Tax=unclassified Streptomyces TaxID=2593676 RepID=UPI002DDAF36D|nr:hypothetical protein [Streptomyces sp. NBC_01795]WSA93785.1 hypothetical protein OIE63_21025 [Streptomyces sp. NBC_01795]WSS42388.1 hypothetical protein OG220_18730 [Streptomyces sp. NBC_01187]
MAAMALMVAAGAVTATGAGAATGATTGAGAATGDGAGGGDGAGAGGGGGWHGPVVSRPAQPELDYPRGEVCAFPVHATFPVVDMVKKTWFNDAGDPVFAITSGPLVMDAKNLDTGKTVRRDLSGTGPQTYPRPGSDTHVLSGGDWGALLHSGDRPVHNKWLISRGFMSVKYTKKDGRTTRELLALEGRYEDLCKTLGR